MCFDHTGLHVVNAFAGVTPGRGGSANNGRVSMCSPIERYTAKVEIPDQVVAWFVDGVITDHVIKSEWAPDDCGPCAALYWLYVHRPDETSAAIARQLGANWDWQKNGKINWPWLVERYRQAAQSG